MRTIRLLVASMVLTTSIADQRLHFNVFEEAMDNMMDFEIVQFKKSQECQFKDKVIFFLYQRMRDGSIYESHTDIDQRGEMHDGRLDCTKRLHIGIHGWQQPKYSKFAKEMIKAYVSEKNQQVVTVRWKAADQGYVDARRSIFKVAQKIHTYLKRIESCVPLRNITIIGHSLGAQLAGVVGYMTYGEIDTLVALEPARVLFFENTTKSVSAASAKRVIGVHTNAGYYGVDYNVGHVDFWPNMGKTPQPACRNYSAQGFQDALSDVVNPYDSVAAHMISCSHEQSIYYFFNSVRDPIMYMGRKCKCTNRETCDWDYGHHGQYDYKYMNEFAKGPGQYCFFA